MKEELLEQLYTHLKARFPDKNVTWHRRNQCVGLEGVNGSMLIYHEAYSNQFYGNFYDKKTRKTSELIDKAAEIGLRTQFMYSSVEKAPGIFKQLETLALSA